MAAEDNRTRILVVEDDAEIRMMMRELLEAGGYEMLEAENGAVAWSMLAESAHVDLILLDMAMPIMDGATFLALLHESETLARIPVVIVTADSRVRPDGAVALLRKPTRPDDLLRLVATHCLPARHEPDA